MTGIKGIQKMQTASASWIADSKSRIEYSWKNASPNRRTGHRKLRGQKNTKSLHAYLEDFGSLVLVPKVTTFLAILVCIKLFSDDLMVRDTHATDEHQQTIKSPCKRNCDAFWQIELLKIYTKDTCCRSTPAHTSEWILLHTSMDRFPPTTDWQRQKMA